MVYFSDQLQEIAACDIFQPGEVQYGEPAAPKLPDVQPGSYSVQELGVPGSDRVREFDLSRARPRTAYSLRAAVQTEHGTDAAVFPGGQETALRARAAPQTRNVLGSLEPAERFLGGRAHRQLGAAAAEVRSLRP